MGEGRTRGAHYDNDKYHDGNNGLQGGQEALSQRTLKLKECLVAIAAARTLVRPVTFHAVQWFLNGDNYEARETKVRNRASSFPLSQGPLAAREPGPQRRAGRAPGLGLALATTQNCGRGSGRHLACEWPALGGRLPRSGGRGGAEVRGGA